ncbi:MAG: hypothetical protein WBJ81_05500 [Rickettsiales bacterium]
MRLADKSVFVRIAQRLERKGYKIKILCGDKYEGYRCYKLAGKHLAKAETRKLSHMLLSC